MYKIRDTCQFNVISYEVLYPCLRTYLALGFADVAKVHVVRRHGPQVIIVNGFFRPIRHDLQHFLIAIRASGSAYTINVTVTRSFYRNIINTIPILDFSLRNYRRHCFFFFFSSIEYYTRDFVRF